jgi:hypothetical protein
MLSTRLTFQLFAAGDTISHLNSRTPQLQGIMTDLQQSFSEISRLAEAVSLPPQALEVVGAKSPVANDTRWDRDVARLRLMVLAEGNAFAPSSLCLLMVEPEPPERIKDRFEMFREPLTKAAESKTNESARSLLDQCERLVQDSTGNPNAPIDNASL